MRLRVVLFDWGNTLMRDFPQYPGPMARWPRVEAVPGAGEALAALHGPYQVAVATNAADSGRELVGEALTRAGLLQHVDEVFTFRELGVRKPDRAFFRSILDHLGSVPQEAVMVGDDYWSDVAGASRAGLWAVWYNPWGRKPPPQFDPCDHLAIGHLRELPGALEHIEMSLRNGSE